MAKQIVEPLVSAIIPAYNRSDMLKRAVLSVLEQDYPNLELIVVDDCSTEDLTEVKEIIENAKQTFIHLDKNSGPATARNRGAKSSFGKWLAFLDSDDYWLPQKISKQVEFHLNNPKVSISQCREIWYRNKKRVNPSQKHEMSAGDIFNISLRQCIVSSSSVFISKEFYNQFDGYDPIFRACEDYDLWIRIACKHQFGLLDDRLTVKYGGHEDQLSKTYPAMDRLRLYSLIRLSNRPELSSAQKEAVRDEIIYKANLLKKGALKRSISTEMYDLILEQTKLESSIENLDQLLGPAQLSN